MSNGRITKYIPRKELITAVADAAVLEPEPRYRSWSNFTSQRSVRQIAVAPHSRHLWLATWGGVLSWNRQEKGKYLYHRYSSEHGLVGNSVAAICVTDGEVPWAAHEEGGLATFDGQLWQEYGFLQQRAMRVICPTVETGIWAADDDIIYRIRQSDQPPEPIVTNHNASVNVMALLDNQGSLLVGTAWGLFVIKDDFKPQAIAPESIACCIALTRAGGQIWVATPDEVYRLEGGDTVAGPIVPEEDLASIGRIKALAGGHSLVWVLTGTGLAQIIDEQWLPVPEDGSTERIREIHCIAASQDDNYLWVGVDNRLAGLQVRGQEVRWDNNLLPAHEEDSLNNVGRCLVGLPDCSDVLVGTATGLAKISPAGTVAVEETDSDVRSLAVAGEEIWMLARPHGLRRYGAGIPRRPLALPTALATGQDEQVSAIMGNSLYQLGVESPEILARFVPGPVTALCQSNDEVWWVGTANGLYRLSPHGWKFVGTQPGPLQESINALAIIGSRLWAATDANLWALTAGNWETHPIGVDNKPVACLALTPANQVAIWVARPDGLLLYDPATKSVKEEYTLAESGLGSYRVTALLEHAGYLWIVTQAGVSRLALKDMR